MSNMLKGFLKALAIVGIGYLILYYVSYNNWKKSAITDNDYSYRESSDSNTEVKDNNDNNNDYKTLYDSVKFEFLEYNYGEEFFDYYYGNKKFDSKFYIYMAIINLIKDENIINCNLEKEISSFEVLKKVNDIFGDVEVSNMSITTANNFININYDEVKDIYSIKVNDKCSGFDFINGGIKNEYYDASIKGDYLYINEKAFYLYSQKDPDGVVTYKYYKDVVKDDLYGSNDYNNIKLDSITSYIYKFEIKDNNYRFISVNKDI